jgi:hypothetical protein
VFDGSCAVWFPVRRAGRRPERFAGLALRATGSAGFLRLTGGKAGPGGFSDIFHRGLPGLRLGRPQDEAGGRGMEDSPQAGKLTGGLRPAARAGIGRETEMVAVPTLLVVAAILAAEITWIAKA